MARIFLKGAFLVRFTAAGMTLALAMFAAVPIVSYGAVSAVSQNAIGIDCSDWSKVTVASETALQSFSSMKLGTVIIVR